MKFGNILEKKKEQEEKKLQKQKKLEELQKLRPFTMHFNREDVGQVLREREVKNYRRKYDQPSHFGRKQNRGAGGGLRSGRPPHPLQASSKLSLDENSLISHQGITPKTLPPIKSTKALNQQQGATPKMRPKNNI